MSVRDTWVETRRGMVLMVVAWGCGGAGKQLRGRRSGAGAGAGAAEPLAVRGEEEGRNREGERALDIPPAYEAAPGRLQ